jgi:hypothetical protein
MQTIRDIAKVPTDMYEKPRIAVHIVDCGELDVSDSKNNKQKKGEEVNEPEEELTIV